MNKVIISGNLTKDMDVMVSKNDMNIGNFTVAVNNGYGENVNTQFYPVVLFGKRVESLEKILVKGAGVIIEGQLDYNSVKDEQGNWKNYMNVVVNDIEITRFVQNNQYDNMSVEELREECKKQNIKYGFKDSKEMLIKKLNA